jgi:hypothetical protein
VQELQGRDDYDSYMKFWDQYLASLSARGPADFEPACLEFYKTARSVHTVSSEQVRRPVNREGIHQWRHFEPWLARLRQALGPLATS